MNSKKHIANYMTTIHADVGYRKPYTKSNSVTIGQARPFCENLISLPIAIVADCASRTFLCIIYKWYHRPDLSVYHL